MGDPRKNRKKYDTPMHPWNKARIDSEKILTREYGIRRKNEIWKHDSMLKNFHDVAKEVVAEGAKGETKKKQMIARLQKLGIITKDSNTTDAVLNVTLKDIMERRLQTLLLRKGFARTPLQARQFITHGHIKIGNRKVTAPSFLVPMKEESNINFVARSSLFSEEHPERVRKDAEPLVMEKTEETKAEEGIAQ